MDTKPGAPGHLETWEVAVYLDDALSPADRSRVERHLVDCDDCRTEIITVARLLRTQPRRGWYIPIGIAAAAAAAVLLLVWPGSIEEPVGPPNYREPVVTTTVAPIGIAPRGAIATAPWLVWTRVPHADRYRLTLFDATGRVIWESQTRDTSAAFPKTIGLQPRASYFWKVEAQTGWNRWVGSDLIEFSLASPRP